MIGGPRYCTECGERLPPNARFCPRCGSRVRHDDDIGPTRDPRPKPLTIDDFTDEDAPE